MPHHHHHHGGGWAGRGGGWYPQPIWYGGYAEPSTVIVEQPVLDPRIATLTAPAPASAASSLSKYLPGLAIAAVVYFLVLRK